MTLKEWLSRFDNVTAVYDLNIGLAPDKAYHVRLPGDQLIRTLVVNPIDDVFTLAQTLITLRDNPLLVLVDAPPPADGAILDNWYDDHQVEKMLHALFFGRVYYWHDEHVTAIHYVSDSGFNRRTAQPAPPSAYPFDTLQTSRPHDCYDSLLEGHEWRTVSFGEHVWWERAQYTTGSTHQGSFQQDRQQYSQRRTHTGTSRRASDERPPMTDADWQEYLERIRAQARRETQWQRTDHWYYAAGTIRQDNRYQQALATLGLSEGATPEQIKTAYRQKAKILHPDMGGDHDLFIQLQQAYEYLME